MAFGLVANDVPRVGWTQESPETIKAIFNPRADFKNEKEMCDYIEANIDLFCRDVLGDHYISHIREYSFFSLRAMKKAKEQKGKINNVRIDFMIRCTNGHYAVEIKNPVQSFTELSRAIGQLMMYEDVLDRKGMEAQIVLVSSKHEDVVTRILKRHGLGYRYIVFNREWMAEIENRQA